MGYIVSRDCSISVTVSRENTLKTNFTVKCEKNTIYHFRTLFSRFKDLPLKYHAKCLPFTDFQINSR